MVYIQIQSENRKKDNIYLFLVRKYVVFFSVSIYSNKQYSMYWESERSKSIYTFFLDSHSQPPLSWSKNFYFYPFYIISLLDDKLKEKDHETLKKLFSCLSVYPWAHLLT